MKSGRYTIHDLFCEGDIGYFCIPEIQRDYVWGEDQVLPFVQGIVKSIKKAIPAVPEGIPESYKRQFAEFLKQSARYNIGFIYAYFDRSIPSRFFLVDGQQRLTTIYLVLAVLAAKDERCREIFRSRYFRFQSRTGDSQANDFRSYQLKVDYKVRETSHVVLQHFVFDLSLAAERQDEFVQEILNGTWKWDEGKHNFPAWWQRRFENDATARSLLDNSSLVAKILTESNIDPLKMFKWIEEGVEVWYFDTALSQQGEELYVYMNSRGEQLNYNENRRAACLSLCETSERRNQLSRDWDNKLQNRYWTQRGDNTSADKGLDMFLHTVEMMVRPPATANSRDEGGTWKNFFEKGVCPSVSASLDILDDYFAYQKAVETLAGPPRQPASPCPDIFDRFAAGVWIAKDAALTQIQIIPYLANLELLKGRAINQNDDWQKFVNCSLFLRNICRHNEVERNPASFIDDLISLARICRENSLDVLSLSASDNRLVNDEEKWRLELLKGRFDNFGPDDLAASLALLDEISEPSSGVIDALKGVSAILFATAFEGAEDAILAQCKTIAFDEMASKLRDAKARFDRHFTITAVANTIPIVNTIRVLLLGGDVVESKGTGLWYPFVLGSRMKESHTWIQHWYVRLSSPKPSASGTRYQRVNGLVVDFLKRDGSQPEKVDVPDGFKLLQRIACSESAWQKLIKVLDSDLWRDGRFRSNGDNPWKPEFKGGRGTSLLWFFTTAWREGSLGHGNAHLSVDYGKTPDDGMDIKVYVLDENDQEIESKTIPFRQDGDWEQDDLNTVIRSFRETGRLTRLP